MDDQELLQAILEAAIESGLEDAKTAQEIAEELKWGVQKVRRTLRVLLADGTAEAVYVRRPTLNHALTGITYRVPGYRLKKG